MEEARVGFALNGLVLVADEHLGDLLSVVLLQVQLGVWLAQGDRWLVLPVFGGTGGPRVNDLGFLEVEQGALAVREQHVLKDLKVPDRLQVRPQVQVCSDLTLPLPELPVFATQRTAAPVLKGNVLGPLDPADLKVFTADNHLLHCPEFTFPDGLAVLNGVNQFAQALLHVQRVGPVLLQRLVVALFVVTYT